MIKIIIHSFENLRFEIKGTNFDLKFLYNVQLVKMKTLNQNAAKKNRQL